MYLNHLNHKPVNPCSVETMSVVDAVKYRNNVIQELYITEKTYINGLTSLITQFIDPLESNTSIICNADYHIIFPKDIKIIYNLHLKLLDEFKKEFDDICSNNHNDNDSSQIGKIFIDHASHFKMYQNYLNNHHKAIQKLSELQNKRKFSKWCLKVQSSLNNQTLNSLLILPIQRIPRYELLLKELIKSTKKINSWHKDLKDLIVAKNNINKINCIINNRIKEHEQREKVKQIKDKFDISSFASFEVIIPSRYFIMDNDNHIITKHDKLGQTVNIYMILFNDGIIYGHSKSRSSIYGRKNTKYLFDNFLPFNNVFEIEDIGQLYKNLHCIKILSSTQSIWISFKNDSFKYQWIKKINESLQIKLNKNKNIRIPNDNVCKLIQCVCLIPNDYSDKCMECGDIFSITNRRHHCYKIKCGKLICGQCSDYKIDQLRVCRTCYTKYQQEQIDKTCCDKLKNIIRSNLHIFIVIVIIAIVFQDIIIAALSRLLTYIFGLVFQ